MDTRNRRVRPRAATWVWLLLLLVPAGAGAGTTGKISGRVMGGAAKQPLAGVNVAVPAARTGAITDEQGRYVILNVPSGTYEVRFNLLGYRAVAVQNVIVSADVTTELKDVQLVEAPVAMEEVVVNATRPVVDLKLTSNLATVNRQQIAKLPVQELQDIVNLQAGVVDGHVRGGRIGEVQYQVDGVTVNDPVNNKSGLRLDRSLLEEVQVVSGTFDAEYGQAMSGVVNAVLRRGGDQFQWNAEVYGGAFAYSADSAYRGGYEYHPAALQSYQMSVSGPTGLPKTTFLLNGRWASSDDYVRATRLFTPWQAKTPQDKVANPDGDSLNMALGYSREWSAVAKVTNRSIPGIELSYQAIVDSVVGRKSNYQFRLNPDGLTNQYTRSIVHGIDLTHTLSHKTFYTLSVRQNLFSYRDLKYSDLYDPRYLQAGAPKYDPTRYQNDAYVEGVDLNRYKQWTNTPIVKGSFVSQISHDHQIKVGGEYQWPHVEFGSPGYLVDLGTSIERIVNQPPNFPAIPHWRPDIAAAYAQDEMEWNDLHVRAGLRLDYFSARATVPSDLSNPANSIPGAPPSVPVPTTPKTSLSPRIGVSYPVTQRSALFFAYGHFYQYPELGQIFTQADYNLLSGLQAGGIDYGVMGNPDIKAERTVQYQLGFKQSITDDFGVDVTMFYKDIRDLLGVEFITTYNDAEYARLTNVDFGSVTGFTLSLTRRAGRIFSTELNYTWQNAQGNASDPHETATRAAAGEDPRPRSVPFNWDQRHTLVMTVNAASLDNFFNLSAIVRAASGQPFTPAIATGFGNGLEDNSGRKPVVFNIDLRGEMNVHISGVPGTFFGRIFNLTDSRFNNGLVFDTSGSPYYSRFPTKDYVALADPTRYYAPRRIEVGLSLRSGK